MLLAFFIDLELCLDGTNHTQINKVIAHPTLPLIVTAHEDKYIRFFDSKSGVGDHVNIKQNLPSFFSILGDVIHSMTAHMDAVTGLAIDPHGLYLLSGSVLFLIVCSCG